MGYVLRRIPLLLVAKHLDPHWLFFLSCHSCFAPFHGPRIPGRTVLFMSASTLRLQMHERFGLRTNATWAVWKLRAAGLRYVGPLMLRANDVKADLTKLSIWVERKMLKTDVAEIFSALDLHTSLLFSC